MGGAVGPFKLVAVQPRLIPKEYRMKDKKVRIQGSRVRAPKQIIGVDIGDRISRVCVHSGDCVIVREEPLPTTPEAFMERFGGLGRAVR